MKRRTPLPGRKLLAAASIAMLAGASIAMLAAAPPPPTADGQDGSWDNYRLLVDRNIFLRYRRRTTPRAPSSQPRTYAPRDDDNDIVLTGIARRDGEYVAFFENTAIEVTARARVGEAVGNGRITAITLDGVDYERGGSVRRIQIDHALRGGRYVRETIAAGPPPATRPAGPSAPTTQPATAPSAPAAQSRPATTGGGAKSSDVADILKRMRQRRERELRR